MTVLFGNDTRVGPMLKQTMSLIDLKLRGGCNFVFLNPGNRIKIDRSLIKHGPEIFF